jgi:hypothetical protein
MGEPPKVIVQRAADSSVPAHVSDFDAALIGSAREALATRFLG